MEAPGPELSCVCAWPSGTTSRQATSSDLSNHLGLAIGKRSWLSGAGSCGSLLSTMHAGGPVLPAAAGEAEPAGG